MFCGSALRTDYTFSAYATGGLETQLQTSLFVVAGYLTVRLIEDAAWRPGPLVGLSLIFAAALLTRLDLAICVAVFGVAAAVGLFRERVPTASKLARTSALCLPAISVLEAWLLWKVSYYGSVLPNTYYVKVSSGTSLIRGLTYLWLFVFSYWLTPFIIILLWRMKDVVSRAGVGLWLSLVLVSLWCLYIVKVGGDFMEFRQLVPILPFVMILVVWLMFACVQQRELRAALAITMLLASVNHAVMFETTREIGSIRELSGYMADSAPGWPAVGRTLARLFPKEKGVVTLAATPVGAIPYYSSLPTIDMHGLNDAWVARHGRINGSVPGHQRLATLDYLLSRGTNLVIGHPLVAPLGAAHKSRYELEDLEAFRIPLEGVSPQMVPENARVIEIPIGVGSKIDVLYLVQSPVVDAVIEAEALKTYPVVAR